MTVQRCAVVVVAGFLLGSAVPHAQTKEPILIRVGTIVPRNSAWYDTLE
jgi:hypothetical protein